MSYDGSSDSGLSKNEEAGRPRDEVRCFATKQKKEGIAAAE
jgi:hypothetical protein